jgi:hypothetical protein
MNHEFASYVTSTAFNLQLSPSMILRLIDAYNDEARSRIEKTKILCVSYDNTVGATRALKRRGLVKAVDPKFPGYVRPTRAGELVVELLKEAGIVSKYTLDKTEK